MSLTTFPLRQASTHNYTEPDTPELQNPPNVTLKFNLTRGSHSPFLPVTLVFFAIEPQHHHVFECQYRGLTEMNEDALLSDDLLLYP